MSDKLSTTDKKLLKFVLNANVQDWRDWASSTDIDDHSSIAYQLFPSAYKKLERMGEAHPWRSRLKGVYRRQWTQNKIHTANYLRIVQTLSNAGIRSILPIDQQISALLDGSAEYPLEEPRITVPWMSIPKAINVLTANGWKMSAPHLTRVRLRDKLACSDWRLTDATGNSVWLTDHYHRMRSGQNADAYIWSVAHPSVVKGAYEVGVPDLIYAAATDRIHTPNSIVWTIALTSALKYLVSHNDLKSVPVSAPEVCKLIQQRCLFLEEFITSDFNLVQVSQYLTQPQLSNSEKPLSSFKTVRRLSRVFQLLNRWGGLVGLRTYLRQMNSAQ